MTDKPNLYQKLLAITEEIGKIDKTGHNSLQNYNFIEQGQVAAEVRVQLVKHGVMIIPEVYDRTLERYEVVRSSGKPGIDIHASIKTRFTLVNADNPEEFKVCEWDAGEAIDSSDKATNKAGTAAHKNFLMKLFNISDKDDPDAHSPEPPPEAKKTKPTESTLVKLQVKARTLMAAKDIRGDKANGFLQLVINKDKPTTASDFEAIIKALEEEE